MQAELQICKGISWHAKPKEIDWKDILPSRKVITFDSYDHKQVLSAAKLFCSKDLRPFHAITGDGMAELLKAVSAVTLRHGLLNDDALQRLLPAPTTVSTEKNQVL